MFWGTPLPPEKGRDKGGTVMGHRFSLSDWNFFMVFWPIGTAWVIIVNKIPLDRYKSLGHTSRDTKATHAEETT